MILEQPTSGRQLLLKWEAGPPTKPHHTAEWVEGSAICPAITDHAIESIAGSSDVLGFLNPTKLGRVGGYATMPVVRARQRYANPILGGWLAYGHQPLDDGQLIPIAFKPDHPRLSVDREPIKYERPVGSAPVPYFAPLTAEAVEAICIRAEIQAPAFRKSWDSWLWLLAQREVELFLDEGEKKAAAACSHGFLTIGLAGIWNGCPRPRDINGEKFGSHTLVAELQWLKQVRPSGSRITIAFDASEKPAGRIAIRRARRALGRLLTADGHLVSIREIVQPESTASFIKGTDDLLVAGGAAAVEALPVTPLQEWMESSSKQAVVDHLLHPFKTKNRRCRTIGRHFKGSDIARHAPLVALIGGMGSNKTGAVAELARDEKLISITHRRSLADNQGHRFGLGVKREGKLLYEFGSSAGTSVPESRELIAARVKREFISEQTAQREMYNSGELRPGGRAVDGSGLENQECESIRGFNGHPLREQSGLVPETSATNVEDKQEPLSERSGLVARRAHNPKVGGLVPSLLADQEGFITVADSSFIGGTGQITPDECRDSILFIDEADAFLRHCLTAETAIKAHRCEVLENLSACVQAAQQVVLAGAHIDETTLRAFEAMRGGSSKAAVVQSTLQPAFGRDLTIYRKTEQLLQQLRNLATHREPMLFHTGSKESNSKFSPANLSRLIRRWWPDARILDLTAETIRDPNHLGSKAINDPQLLLQFDVVLATPVLETGFSIEDREGHFKAVLGYTSGHTMPHAFVQSLGRLRSDAPRHVWCNHTGTRIGNGAPIADEIERTKLDHANRLTLLHLHEADQTTADASRFVECWSELAASQNWMSSHYRLGVATLLEQEGYSVHRLDAEPLNACHGSDLNDELSAARDAVVAEETAEVAAIPAPTAEQLEQLEGKQRLTRKQRQMIERGRIARDLGLVAPSAEQVAISRNRSYCKLKQHLLVIDPAFRKHSATNAADALSPSERRFAPDATRAMTPFSRANLLAQFKWLLDALDTAGSGETITMQPFEAHHDAAKADAARWREVFGFNPCSGTTRTFLANLLDLLGFKLQRVARRSRSDQRIWWHYEVVDEFKALDRSRVHSTMREALQ